MSLIDFCKLNKILHDLLFVKTNFSSSILSEKIPRVLSQTLWRTENTHQVNDPFTELL